MSSAAYSRTQIILHWVVAALVLFQLFLHGSIVEAWTGRMNGSLPNQPTPDLHVIAGVLIFGLVVWRLILRFTRSVPALPTQEPRLLKVVATGTHLLFYVLLLAMPLSGAAAWFLGAEPAALAHSLARFALIPLLALHVLAALAHHFWFRTNVLRRMLGRA